LEIISGGGIIAVALVTWFFAAFIKRACKCLRARHSFRRATCLGALAGICSAAVHSFVDFGLHVTINALVFTSLVVIATTHMRADERGPSINDEQRPSLPDSESPARVKESTPRPETSRAGIAVGCIVVCLFAVCVSARAGLSRWYSVSEEREYSLASAERAVRLAPSDASSLFFHASLLPTEGKNVESLEEFERALALRPRDHLLWINLGFARDRVGDLSGAIAALQEAAKLAPFYAQPRWQLGKALLRAGQRERAFAELSRAAASDPDLLPRVLKLLWATLDGDAGELVRVVSPQSPWARVARTLPN
jgi:tetratricopeptide (TPR) repeat protein